MATLAPEFFTLGFQGKTGVLNHVVEHPREDTDDLAEPIPVELRVARKGTLDQRREVYTAKQAAAIRRQGLFTTVLLLSRPLGHY